MKSLFIQFVVFVVLSLFGSVRCIKYNTGAGIVENKLNVHLVPHSHDDVGWLKNVDQYYVGSNASIQVACVENVLDSVVAALRRDSNRKFVFAEQAFFQRWWATQDKQMQDDVRKLVDAGQLEFVNGGWCMHDEAATHYIDMIDQTTLGHRFIKQQFNTTPRAGWQIDPFGHSAVQAYLLGAELGFDSVHFSRIDYQDKLTREGLKSLETIWQGSKSFGSSSQIFTNVFPVDYGPPENFHFGITDEHSTPVQDNPLLNDYNVQQRVQEFFDAAIKQANVTRTNHIMWTMGGDFEYQYAETWFKNMDKLIHYVNKDGRVNALYSTPSVYTDAKYAANLPWPLKTDDFFPYADAENSYWTGYFTSRPAFKRYVRALSGYYLAARQLEFLSGRKIAGPTTSSLGDALGIAQHHDAVSGTAKQHTTDDYMKRLAAGASEAEAVTNVALTSLLSAKSSVSTKPTSVAFGQCQLLNISYCPSTEEDIPDGKSLVMVAYNPLGWTRTEVIRIPVANVDLVVHDASGTMVEAQFIGIDNVTMNLRNYYTKIYLGNSPKNVPMYWLYFSVSVPPLGWSTYFISENNVKGDTKRSFEPIPENPKTKNVVIGPGKLKMSFSSSGDLIQMSNSESGVNLPVQQNILWYTANVGDGQSPGAYVFRPSATPVVANITAPVKVVRGPIVEEFHQQFDSWVYQVTRLYKDREHAEIEYTIGPIPADDYSGKDVITRMKTKMITNREFYTDSNGRDFLRRIRDYRGDWNLSVNEPVAGNYYPINLGMYINDSSYEFSVLVDRATGGSSINDGEIELMLHRRFSTDDGKGLSEALDEQVCAAEGDCQGLTIRGNYYMGIHKVGAGAKWRRTTGQQIYSHLLFAFTHENADTWKASRSTKASTMDLNYNLPPNVALVTLQELEDKTVLLRLAHLYEAGEDAEHSRLARVELKKMFSGKQIKEAKEMNLSANQEKAGMRARLEWKIEGQSNDKNSNKNNKMGGKGVRGSPLNSSTFVVELGPMEIRTFLLKFI